MAYAGAMIVRALRRGHEIRLVLFSLWAAVIIWRVWRRFTFRGPGLAQVRLSDAGCLQADSTEDADQATPTPWDKVEAVKLERAGDGAWHLRLASKATWWSSGTAYVDAEVKCGDERAAAIGERIEAWRKAVAAPPAPSPAPAPAAAPQSTEKNGDYATSG